MEKKQTFKQRLLEIETMNRLRDKVKEQEQKIKELDNIIDTISQLLNAYDLGENNIYVDNQNNLLYKKIEQLKDIEKKYDAIMNMCTPKFAKSQS